MKSIAFFKKFAIFPLALALLSSSAAISVSAAGVDDGVISVTTKNAVKYFGTKKSDFCTEYVAANGEDGAFLRYENIDINGDRDSDITDLVALHNQLKQNSGTDLDFSSSADNNDLAVLRKTLIGITDILK